MELGTTSLPRSRSCSQIYICLLPRDGYQISSVNLDPWAQKFGLAMEMSKDTSKVKAARLQRLAKEDLTLHDEITNTIAKNSQGMYVYQESLRLFLYFIDAPNKVLVSSTAYELSSSEVSRKGVRLALENLPKELDSTYDEAMQRTEDRNRDVELAHQVLSWIHATRPLTVEEIQHALAVEINHTSIGEETLIYEDPSVSVYAGLGYSKRAHLQRFPDAQQNITAACLTYPSFDVFEEGCCTTGRMFENRLQQNPLLSCAARNWGNHARGDAEKAITELAMELLMNSGMFSSSSQAVLAPEHQYLRHIYGVSKQFSGMHIVAYYGLKHIMIALLEEGMALGSTDSDGQTPLPWASEN
ncbi:MAG: hypothetical protein M1840_006468 [Geoglossum simile]|nr:MAG: hypothetical protein M1840_006468 [Geoglossum simile]